jgi:glucose-1-phosphate thymidylyltransferase
MWGIVPAAGAGTRIQPLAFSKELLPVGSRVEDGVERPRAVSEYLVERMVRGGATKICFVVSPGKTDIIAYYGAAQCSADVCFTVQPNPAGLCDAIFRALPFVHPEEHVLVGLPDTVWFPVDGFRALPDGVLSFLLFPVENPEVFDAVLTDEAGRVVEIEVKVPAPRSRHVWGAFKMPGRVLHALHALWVGRERRDEYFGTLVNAWLAQGNVALGVPAGEAYVDVGTLGGYRDAIGTLERRLEKQREVVEIRTRPVVERAVSIAVTPGDLRA